MNGIRNLKPVGESAHPPQCRESTHTTSSFVLGSQKSIARLKEIILLQGERVGREGGELVLAGKLRMDSKH